VPNKNSIELRQPVLDYLRGVADERNRQDRERGYKHRPGVFGDNAQRKGVMGEFVYCAWAGIDYTQHAFDTRPPWEDDDINGIQIRASSHSWGDLLTHEYDPPGAYVLVTLDKVHQDLIVGTLRGWQWLNECNVAHRWNTRLPRPAYATPQSALHPMDTLDVKYN
jgi:hypothetical protein